eukprot:TRINITY_DN11120_c0_g1_i4.p1 TRINITY_DN11120_c0_g1~~TRINITY_DN11120_c0_g1_i4.p1  ORF type:complete len:1173 (+),score=234.61 TRINITY_DN11120_c0_g1_i4:233-3751(+)
MREGTQLEEIKKRYCDLDANGNGNLCFDEFKQLLRAGNPTMSERDLHVLFRAIDKDNSGDIIFDEFVDYIMTPGEWFEAARQGDSQKLSELIDEGVSLSARETRELAGLGMDALMISAYCGRDECVELLISKKADVNSRGKLYGRTPVMLACEQGNYGCLFTLNDAGGSLILKDIGGTTPLMFACKQGHDRCVKFLLRRSVDLDVKDNSGWTALAWCAAEAYMDSMRRLLDDKADINSRNESGKTAAMIAAHNCNERCLHLLLDKQADVETEDFQGNTALDLAKANRKETCVRILETSLTGQSALGGLNACSLGLNFASSEDQETKQEWFQFVWEGNREGIQAFIREERVAVDTTTKEGWTAAMVAAIEGHAEILQLLIYEGADLEKLDNGGFTAVMLAAKKGNRACLRKLLEEGVDVNMVAESDRTAVSLACEDGQSGCIQLLFTHSADMNRKAKYGKATGQSPAMIYLCSVGCILRLKKVHERVHRKAEEVRAQRKSLEAIMGGQVSTPSQRDRSDSSPQNNMQELGHLLFKNVKSESGCGDAAAGPVKTESTIGSSTKFEDDPKALEEFFRAVHNGRPGKVDELLQKGLDPDSREHRTGTTAAMKAAWSGHVRIVRILARRSANLNLRSRNDGHTALIMAAVRGEVEVIRALLEFHANPDSRCFVGKTALIMTCTSGLVVPTKLLCEFRCNCDAKDDTGSTAAMYAASASASMNHWECLVTLDQAGASFLVKTHNGTLRNALHILENSVDSATEDGFSRVKRFPDVMNWTLPAAQGVFELREATREASLGGISNKQQLTSLHFQLFKENPQVKDDVGNDKLEVRDSRFAFRMAAATSELLDFCQKRTLSDQDKGLLSTILSAGILRAVPQDLRDELLEQNSDVLETLEKTLDLRQSNLTEVATLTEHVDTYLQRRDRYGELSTSKLDQRDACPSELWEWLEDLPDGCFDRLRLVFKAFKDASVVRNVAEFSNYLIENDLTQDSALFAKASAHLLVGYAKAVDDHFANFMKETFGNRFKRAPVKKLKRIFAKMLADEPRLADDDQAAESLELRSAYFDLGDLVRGSVRAQGAWEMSETIAKLRSIGKGTRNMDYKFEAWRIKNTHHHDSAETTGGYRDVKVLGRFTAPYEKTERDLPISMIVEVQVIDSVFMDVKKFMHKAYSIARGDFD